MNLEPQAEASRLAALHGLELLDTPASESFDRITRMAAHIFGLPIAAVSLTDRDRQWFKSRVGVDHQSIPRVGAPCAQVAETRNVLLIPDLLADPCYKDSILARQGVRFYAGASLVTRDGHGLGALCVLGTEPREVTPLEIASLTDLAAMVMAQIELQHALGRIDPSSGLPNRNQFADDLQDMAREHLGEERLAVVVDLAPPEQVASGIRVLGPTYTDDMIRKAVPAIRRMAGRSTVYHVAGTQFAVVSRIAQDRAGQTALIEEAIAEGRADPALRPLSSATVGVFPFVLGGTEPADVLRGAFGAALDARQGPGPLGIHSPANDRLHWRKHRLLADFEAALATPGQLHLMFQPKIDLASERPVGAEALLRWQHPEFGDVSPAEFVPLVEHSALVRPMTAWVVEQSLAALGRWRRGGLDLPLSINVSAANLEEEDLANRIGLHLLRNGLPPASVQIEVTESAAMMDDSRKQDQLRALATLGAGIAIDDFGAGYSSLSYLQRLPADTVKIDQSFIRDLVGNAREQALTRSMIGLFHALGCRVVAEGVESRAAADLLRAMGCDQGQGFLWARPMSAERLERWMAGAGSSSSAEDTRVAA